MSSEILHALILILVVGLSFIFPSSFFAQFDLQISAGLFIMFFILKKFIGTRFKSHLMESIIFTFVILLTINTTGGINSPFFFLLYFLLFSLSLLLEPVVSITTTLSLMVCFMFTLPAGQSLKSLLPIFSLAFLTPFAMFMGQEFVESQRLKIKSQKLESTLEEKQEETFLFLSLMLKNQLKSILYTIDNFMGDHELGTIKKHVRNMQKLIEKFENQS